MPDKIKVKSSSTERNLAAAQAATEELTDNALEMVLMKESQSSVEITQDAKGSLKVTVKAYADTVDEAADKALEAYDKTKDQLGI